jgi:hypothetical protein
LPVRASSQRDFHPECHPNCPSSSLAANTAALPRSIAEIHASQFSSFLCFLQIISKHPYELGLDCVKPRAEQEPELGSFLALPAVTRGREAQTAIL